MARRIVPMLAVLAALPFAAGCSATPPPSQGLKVGNIAPELEGADASGAPIKLSDFRGKVVVVDFWATWCPPCRGMIPSEKDLVKRMAGRPFAFLGVSADNAAEDLRQYIEAKEIAWPNIFDGRGGPLSQAWEIEAFPTVFVIDAKGVIRWTTVGADERGLVRTVDRLVKEQESGQPQS